MKNTKFLFLTLTLFLFLGACIPSMDIKYDSLAKTDAKRGTVAVGEVNNKRFKEYGGRSFNLLGKIRGGYGNPFDLQTQEGKEINLVLKEMAKNVLEHTGYTSVGADQKAPRLDMDVIRFWCDGYGNKYTIEAEVSAKLVDPAGGKVLAQRGLNFERGFSLSTPGRTREAFDVVFNELQKQLLAFVQSKEFQAAVK
ncbi:MAG: hypothetical protein HY787_01030 [Deltaproteobacteria bacterium]|nr:hypothetical protein [Deltaproteobacteria bacterium]